jgi:hypothetical protein
METLFVECVEGKPYSRWWEPTAEKLVRNGEMTIYQVAVLNRVTGGANGRGEQIRSFMKEAT